MPKKTSTKPTFAGGTHVLTKPEAATVKHAVEQVQRTGGKELTDKTLELERQLESLRQDKERFRSEMLREQLERDLKRTVAFRVFNFLAVETGLVLLIVMLHGARLGGFQLEEWTLNIFVTATIAQISAMAVIITKSLFPGG